jgi:hypothetical protein
MTIPNATFPLSENVTHPPRAHQALVDYFESHCCVTCGPASPDAKYHHHRRHNRNPFAAAPRLQHTGSALLCNIQLP